MTGDSQGSSSPPDTSSADERIGSVVAGKYQLIKLLGQGGMGAVYEAKNNVTLKRVAVKLLFDDIGRDEGVVKRFFREAQASSMIESDYIVQVYDSGNDPATGFPYMVMEMLHGEDLE
jgi:serine/threonine protein kinase